MVNYWALREFEESQQDAITAARQRIDVAEEGVAYYRSRIHWMQEALYEFARQGDVADDSGVRAAFQRVSEEAEGHVRAANEVIARFEEDLEAMPAQHAEERERFIAEHADDQTE